MHGGDRPGIVSAVVAVIAGVGGNITDLTTRLAGDLYLLVAEVDLPSGADAGRASSATWPRWPPTSASASRCAPAETDEL